MTPVMDQSDTPELTLFAQPNPFSNQTQLSFTIPIKAHATLEVIDLMGRPVRTLIRGVLNPGSHEYVLTREELADGIYYCRLTVNDRFAYKVISLF